MGAGDQVQKPVAKTTTVRRPASAQGDACRQGSDVRLCAAGLGDDDAQDRRRMRTQNKWGSRRRQALRLDRYHHGWLCHLRYSGAINGQPDPEQNSGNHHDH